MDEGDNASVLEALKHEYEETLGELDRPSGQVLAAFRAEYEHLFKALLRSHESENRLIKKIRDLTAEIEESEQKVREAMKNTTEDQQQIANLRRDIDAQQRLVEQSLQKEALAKEAIARNKAEIEDLTKRIEQGAGMTIEQENQLAQLKVQKEQLEKDRDLLKQNTDMLQNVCETRFKDLQKRELDLTASEGKIVEMKHLVAEKHQQIEAEKRRKEELEQQMKDLCVENELRQEELSGVQRAIQNEEVELKKIEHEILEAEKDYERLDKRVRQKMDETKKLDQKLSQESDRIDKYTKDNQQRELALRAKRDEIQQHENEKAKLVKMHEALRAKEKVFQEERSKLETTRNTIKQDLKLAQDKSESLKRDADVDRKKIEDVLRERDILNKRVTKNNDRTKKQIDLVKRQETQHMNMQKDIARWKRDAQEFRKRIRDLERQREKYGVELSEANAKYFSAKEELKTRGVVLTELQKQIANVQAKRNHYKNLYDSISNDRNQHDKTLQEKNEEIKEMKRKFKIMFHDTQALKEEIRDKDERLMKCHCDKDKVEELNERLKDAKEKAQRRMRNLSNIVETQRSQLKKLESTIQEAEQERQQQQKELEGVIGERDILGAQLIRRNEELALLYEKIKIQQSTLQKGEIQYQERVQEVNSLRNEIRKSKNDVAGVKAQVANTQSMKREIHHLNKTLLREQTKEKALQEELENPMNVHRWRKLEGSDPATFEDIQKVKSLQKLLIAKTEEVMEKDACIQEKEQLYVQLKNIIARQPGPEVAEQLAWYSQNLKEKTQHMKQMAQELQMYYDQVQDLRDETDRHNRDFQATKQAYFQQRRRQNRTQQLQQQSELTAM